MESYPSDMDDPPTSIRFELMDSGQKFMKLLDDSSEYLH